MSLEKVSLEYANFTFSPKRNVSREFFFESIKNIVSLELLEDKSNAVKKLREELGLEDNENFYYVLLRATMFFLKKEQELFVQGDKIKCSNVFSDTPNIFCSFEKNEP